MRRAQIIRWFVLLVLALLWFTPLASLVLYSFAPPAEVLKGGFVPTQWTLQNYWTVLTDTTRGVSVPQGLANSTIIMVCQVVGILLLDIPAAYAFARMRFIGRDVIFILVLATMMMPGVLDIISLYDLMANLGLINTLAGVILPGLPRVIGIFILRQFFLEIPREMEEAARMDGATDFQIFTRIMVPLAWPSIMTVAVITALYSWNNFLWPLIVTNSPEAMPVPVVIAYLSADTTAVLNYTVILAAAFVTSLPMILLFMLGQRWIVSGMRPSSGIK
ncbi:carbohydrate ABC transporter permease [Devosia nitrariae]|uniref:sn-glycerol-3-phosphate transport system permease protein UgpE n=1 Tax=Devosia nitrariae TaxID=2071872 RepID=A0ABQ5W9X4_9HYPH|nr:carbohydrate ABC transporter permease [Devosia nitrariae]GLQ56882.1 sugar ABC transporter permease [Devosia nitrariae]